MTLTFATWLSSACLIGLGLWTLFKLKSQSCVQCMRSLSFTLMLMILASGWFLMHIYNLGEADFGLYKKQLLIGFGILAVFSIRYVPDFLSVRALAILGLLSSHSLLQAAFMQAPTSRLWLVSFAYILIIISLVFAALPYLLRNVIELFEKKPHIKVAFSISFIAYGCILAGCALTY